VNASKLCDQSGNYRGSLSSNPFDPDSTSNPYRRYGSPYSPESINNPYGAGSPYRSDSPNNRSGPAGRFKAATIDWGPLHKQFDLVLASANRAIGLLKGECVTAAVREKSGSKLCATFDGGFAPLHLCECKRSEVALVDL
jgi:hypothetical protein